MNTSCPERLALFDFDGTLTTRDSLIPFLRFAAGEGRFWAGALRSAPSLLTFAVQPSTNSQAKQTLLTNVIAGRAREELGAWGERFARDRIPSLLRPSTMQRLLNHRTAGDVCVLVSASLDVYLQPWARANGFDAVLCSELETDGSGRVTGRIVDANCHGPEKARRINAWLQGRTPGHITAYGDSRGDREMLAMAQVANWIK